MTAERSTREKEFLLPRPPPKKKKNHHPARPYKGSTAVLSVCRAAWRCGGQGRLRETVSPPPRSNSGTQCGAGGGFWS